MTIKEKYQTLKILKYEQEEALLNREWSRYNILVQAIHNLKDDIHFYENTH